MHIAIKPVGADESKPPVWGSFRDLIQGRSQALSYTFQTTQMSHIGQHKGRIGALLAPSLEPPVLAAHPQNGFQQEILRPMLEQALTKVRQNAGVKALIIQWQRERIFPIHASPHHLSGLSIREVFQRLQDSDQRQSP